MPFMVGKSPVRRTLNYLKSGRLIFRENVKIFSVNYRSEHEHTKDFIFWHFSQIQYKNPTVQCITFKNLTPTPFIRIFLEDKRSILIDVDGKTKEEIVNHLNKFTAICKTPEEIDLNLKVKKTYAYFGKDSKRHCMCEVLGQVPCSSLIPVPQTWKSLKKDMRKINPNYIIPQKFMELNLEPKEKDNED